MFLLSSNVPAPTAVNLDDFETAVTKFKSFVVSFIAKSDQTLANSIDATLQNNADTLTKVVEACVYVLQNRLREVNEEAAQMFALWSKGENLDAIVSDFGLKRQVIEPGDANAFPPVDPVLESDADLLNRYFLTLLGFSSAGAKYAYKKEAIQLGESAKITVESVSDDEMIVRYKFEKDGNAGRVKDCSVETPTRGNVLLTLLSRESNGIPPADLLDAARAHFDKDDTAPATDNITIQAASLVDYQINATLKLSPGDAGELIKQDAQNRLADYTEKKKHLGATIEPSYVGHLLHTAGARSYDLTLNKITCTSAQAPNCTGINLLVDYSL